MKILKPILAFAACLWVVAIATYAAQAQGGEAHAKALESLKTMAAGTSCSSSGGSSGGGE